MGKITEALKKAAQERILKLERQELKYQFIAKRTLDSKIDPRIVCFYEPDSEIAEQYRILRTNIQAINSKNPVKAITITSSMHKEGKTITAINLAISMANDLNKKRILLIDADLRRAKVNEYLGFNSEVGLSNLICDGSNIEDALFNIGIDNLTILPSGKIPSNPAELLGSVKMINLIHLLKSKYDYIIIDTPPVIPLTDAGLLGAQTDGVILVIQASRTQKGAVEHAQGLLKQAQAKILGYILTNIEYNMPRYIYRYL